MISYILWQRYLIPCLLLLYRKKTVIESLGLNSLDQVDVLDYKPTYTFTAIWQYISKPTIKIRSKSAIQIILLLRGDIELCPGPNINHHDNFEKLDSCRGLPFYHLNIRGLWNNLALLEYRLSQFKKPVIFSISETHISKEPNDLYHIYGFSFISKARSA